MHIFQSERPPVNPGTSLAADIAAQLEDDGWRFHQGDRRIEKALAIYVKRLACPGCDKRLMRALFAYKYGEMKCLAACEACGAGTEEI